ncbi:MAG: class E sortase [Acidimicrobiia bacterium]|nr:class E sortase [Acidimicrobiia bacterium]
MPDVVELPEPAPTPADPEAPEPVVELGSIAIPAIGIERTLFEGIRIPTYDLGPGHWPGTAMPGRIGNMVIGGHRTSRNADFYALDQLRPGDEMLVTDAKGRTFRYVVERSEITDPLAALRIVNQTPDKTATLFACHPPGEITQRIVVHLALMP